MIRLVSECEMRKRNIDYIKTSYYINPNDASLDEKRKIKIRAYELKIDKSHLNKDTLHQLNIMFLEAKWLLNYTISQDNIYDVDYKINKVPVKVKDIFEERDIKYLSSQMKQEIINRIKDNITGLSETKKRGRNVGKLKFKSEISSIPLIQYGKTHKILDNKYVMIQGIKQKIKIRGLEQILDQMKDEYHSKMLSIEIASGVLIKRREDYYIHVTTYIKEEKEIPIKHIGLDFGISKQITLSNGISIEYSIPITKKIRKLYQKMSRQILHSKNWYNTRNKLRKEFDRLNNIKGDIKNKIVHYISDNYTTVCYQYDNIKSWQRIWGRKILSTAIGGIISTLKTKVRTPVEIDRFFPSTKRCYKCGHEYDIGLNERIYSCKNIECENIMDRDWNSAINIENEGLKKLGMIVGTERIEFKPEEIRSSTSMLGYLNNIPYVTAKCCHIEASLICDIGSFATLE